MTAYLPCPLCDAPAIPPSAFDKDEPLWTEDDEADCPGCGEHLRRDGFDPLALAVARDVCENLED